MSPLLNGLTFAAHHVQHLKRHKQRLQVSLLLSENVTVFKKKVKNSYSFTSGLISIGVHSISIMFWRDSTSLTIYWVFVLWRFLQLSVEVAENVPWSVPALIAAGHTTYRQKGGGLRANNRWCTYSTDLMRNISDLNARFYLQHVYMWSESLESNIYYKKNWLISIPRR